MVSNYSKFYDMLLCESDTEAEEMQLTIPTSHSIMTEAFQLTGKRETIFSAQK